MVAKLLVHVLKLIEHFGLEVGNLAFRFCDVAGHCGEAAFDGRENAIECGFLGVHMRAL